MKYRIYQTGGALAVLAIMAMGMNARSGMATGRMLAADDSTAVDTAQSARQESRTTGTVADKIPPVSLMRWYGLSAMKPY